MPRWEQAYIPVSKTRAAALALLAALLLTTPADARIDNSKNPDNPTNVANPWTEDVNREVGIIEKLNSPVAKGLTLTGEDGKPVALDGFFQSGRPVVLNLGYSRCPSICIVMRDQITDVLADTGLELGKDFMILNISIDPNETPEAARTVRDGVWDRLEEKGVEPSPAGWRFLTGDQETIEKLTDSLGYRYLYIKPQDEYGHPGVLVLADGEGVIRRYMDGKNYDARTLRLSIVETSEGKAGSLLDRAFLTCFVWDPDANNYSATAKFIMMIGGGVMIVMLAGMVFAGLAYEKRRRELMEKQDGPGTPAVGRPNTA